MRLETHDDKLVRVETLAPGFGGMFIDSDGRLRVFLIDPARLAEARRAIEIVFGPAAAPAPGARALQGQYTVSQLKTWAEQAGPLLSLPGTVTVDLDESRNRVVVGIEASSRVSSVEHAIASLHIPREAVIIAVVESIRPIAPR